MDPIAFLQAITLLSIVKALLIVLLGVYAVFAGLMTSQIGGMTRAVIIRDGFIMKSLGIIHFGLAVMVLILAIFIL